MDSTRTPAIGSPVSTPDGYGIMQGVTGHLYAVEYAHGIPSIGLAPGSVMGYPPADVTETLPVYRRADVEWGWDALHLFATLPEMTADNRLQAALMRDALLTPAEYAARRAVTLDRLRRHHVIA